MSRADDVQAAQEQRRCDICQGPLDRGAIRLRHVAHCSGCRLDKSNRWGEEPEFGSIGLYWERKQ